MNPLLATMLSSSPASSPAYCRMLALSLLAFYLPPASARPTAQLLPRQSNNGNSDPGNGLSTDIWLPILVVVVVFAVLTLVACVRRCAFRELGAGSTANNTQNQPAGQAPTARPGRRRRPARTPSQISTKSLPPYMKDPGEHELVIFKGPSDMEDESEDFMPVLEEGDEDLEAGHRDPESHGTTLADNSITNLPSSDISMRRSVDVASMETSGLSHESHSELLPVHSRQLSEVPLEEAPPYSEVASQGPPEMSRNDAPLPEATVQNHSPGDRRSRFSFLLNPFGSPSRHPPLSVHNRPITHHHSGSSLSVASVHSGHRRNRAASSSGSGFMKVFSEHSAPMTSPSTISVDSISAPLTYTLKRSEFRAPKGGLTPEQIKLITSRDALERFGAPYGPDAVAFSVSRSNMAPPPDFEVTVSNLGRESISSADLGNTSSTGGPWGETSPSPDPDVVATDGAVQTASGSGTSAPAPSGVERDMRSSSLSPPSSYQPPWTDSRTSSVTSFETAVSVLSPPITPVTARPVTPVTARPL